MNICAKCEFRVQLEPNSPRAHCDYNNLCSAWDREMIPCVDPVSGKEGYGRHGSLGQFIFSKSLEASRPQCRDKNPLGECDRFRETT